MATSLTAVRPTPSVTSAVRWTEEQGKLALVDRCAGRCEHCGRPWTPLDPAHRKRRSQGGPWSPANLLALCRPCHRLAHDQLLLAQGLGWEVLPEHEPEEQPAWIRTTDRDGHGWHLLTFTDDGTGIRRHVTVPVEPRWLR